MVEEDEITKNSTVTKNSAGTINEDIRFSPYLKEHLNDKFKQFYLLIELEYYALGEQNKKKDAYRYWVMFKQDRIDEQRYRFIRSGSESDLMRL